MVNMFWLVVAYLGLFWLLTLMGCLNDGQRALGNTRNIVDIVLALCVTGFCLLMLKPQYADGLRGNVLLVSIVGLIWEVWSSRSDILRELAETEANKDSDSWLVWGGAIVGVLIVLPGYMVGVLVGLGRL